MSAPYYEAEGVTLYHGDCLDVLPTLGAVDHVITDPPYSDYVHAKSRRGGAEFPDSDTNRASFSRVKEFGFGALTCELRTKATEYVRKLTKRWVLIFSDVESAHHWRKEMVEEWSFLPTFDYVRTGAWVKVGATPQFTGDRPAVGFEAITICHPVGRKRWNGGGTHALWTHPIVLNRSHNDPRLHTTQKPLPLMRELVSLFTDEGETILDPFAGSGTTLVAARNLGRKAIGVELEEKWAEVAAKRLELGPLFATEPRQQQLLEVAP